jgi:DNA primase
MNAETTKFYCHGCKERGNAISFASYCLGISYIASISLLRSAYQPGALDPDEIDMVAEIERLLNLREEIDEQPLLPPSLVDNYEMDWKLAWDAYQEGNGFEPANYMFERGFDWETLTTWGFGWDDFSKRIVFPVYDDVGRLIGFKGRATDGRHPKYLVLGDGPRRSLYGFPRYYPSRVVFGAYRIQDDPVLIVCEGELNAIAVTMKTGLPAVAINGSHFTEYHSKVIRRIASEVILFLDTDRAGDDAVWGWDDERTGKHHSGIVESLSPFLPIRLVPPHEGDPASMTKEEIIECVERSESDLLTFLSEPC